MQRLAILGASGHGKVVADTAECCGWASVEFFDDAWPQNQANGAWSVIGNTEALLERRWPRQLQRGLVQTLPGGFAHGVSWLPDSRCLVLVQSKGHRPWMDNTAHRFEVPRNIKPIRREYSAISTAGRGVAAGFLALCLEIGFHGPRFVKAGGWV